MRIAVVGSGYVGLVTGACFADLGHEVVLVDNDEKKLTALRDGEVPIHEKFLQELLTRHRGKRIQFSGDLQAATRASEAVFIAVGTPPTESGDADLSYVESVAREISGGVEGYKVVVEKSTVPVYTSQWIRTIILRNGRHRRSLMWLRIRNFCGRNGGYGFYVSRPHCGGVENERAAEVMRQIYGPLTSGVLRADGGDSAAGGGEDAAAIDRHQHEERGADQARIQRVSGDEDFVHQCGRVDLRIGGRERAAGLRRGGTDSRIGPRFLNPGIGMGVVFPQGSDGVSGGGEGKRIRFPAAGRSTPY